MGEFIKNALLFLFAFLWLAGIVAEISEPECPVCGSNRHWRQHYWGSNKDYDEYYCSKCYRTTRDMNTGEITTFEAPQDFIG